MLRRDSIAKNSRAMDALGIHEMPVWRRTVEAEINYMRRRAEARPQPMRRICCGTARRNKGVPGFDLLSRSLTRETDGCSAIDSEDWIEVTEWA